MVEILLQKANGELHAALTNKRKALWIWPHTHFSINWHHCKSIADLTTLIGEKLCRSPRIALCLISNVRKVSGLNAGSKTLLLTNEQQNKIQPFCNAVRNATCGRGNFFTWWLRVQPSAVYEVVCVSLQGLNPSRKLLRVGVAAFRIWRQRNDEAHSYLTNTTDGERDLKKPGMFPGDVLFKCPYTQL